MKKNRVRKINQRRQRTLPRIKIREDYSLTLHSKSLVCKRHLCQSDAQQPNLVVQYYSIHYKNIYAAQQTVQLSI